MNILRYDHFRDGGTLVIETDEGTFYVDHRIGDHPTKGKMLDSYPYHNDSCKEVDDQLQIEVYRSLFRFLHNRINHIGMISRHGSVNNYTLTFGEHTLK